MRSPTDTMKWEEVKCPARKCAFLCGANNWRGFIAGQESSRIFPFPRRGQQ
jgi:hypothetical protein